MKKLVESSKIFKNLQIIDEKTCKFFKNLQEFTNNR